ncbi:hypothetical protein D8S78_24545 [Natrialba swarupiae]|nr:hypothetical protein [Natrialba swarupiae]
MVDRDQWLLWKQTDDGRKIPRAPWETGDALRYVDAMNPMNWTSFQEAVRWQSKLPRPPSGVRDYPRRRCRVPGS